MVHRNILIRNKRLTQAMTSIGFTVRVYDNFRTKGVLEKIEKYATNEEMGKCNAFGLAFLSRLRKITPHAYSTIQFGGDLNECSSNVFFESM